MNLTPRQLEIVKFIREYSAANGTSPTMQEIADHLGIRRPTVFEHLKALEARGAITKKPILSRTIELAPELSFGGPVQPRRPHRRRPAHRGHRGPRGPGRRGPLRGRTGETFALQVVGNSMIDEQIRDGDYVIVEKRDSADNGETVVALDRRPGGHPQEVLPRTRPRPPPARQPDHGTHLPGCRPRPGPGRGDWGLRKY